jgi:16S rRNA C967 or C1407 C5-methylase (RsmB/RsmF family)
MNFSITTFFSPLNLPPLKISTRLSKASPKLLHIFTPLPAASPGEYFWKKNPEFYDRVLVDVPCTMEGRIYCGDPKTYQDWSEQKIRDLSVRQQHLLRSAVTSCKVGGTIVYSTCTLAPEENEGVLNWLLEREKGTVQVETISIPGIQGMPGIGSWQGQEYDPEVKNSLRILPSGTMEGFFVAKLRKIKSNMPAPEPVRFGRNRFDRGDRRRDSRRRY